ncbi:hypothetical protein KKE28_03175 [Patescibacteria group bacterium]|nr:hypothetical protein [Patescibacteria group bacterium]MBU1916333.1 hypothetical protein [Patescibacteria group bacterium]
MRKEAPHPGEKFTNESVGQPKNQEAARNDMLNPLVEHTEMYRLLGDSPLRERDIQRYISSNQLLTERLPEIIEHGLGSVLRWDSTELVTQAPEEKRTEIIEQYLTHQMPLIRRHALRLIKYAPPADQEHLQDRAATIIDESLDDPDGESRAFAINFIDQVSIKDQQRLRKRVEELINSDLTNENSSAHNRAIKLIKHASSEQQENLRRRAANRIERDLVQGSPHVKLYAAQLIDELLPADQLRLRKKITKISEDYLNCEKINERMVTAQFIKGNVHYLPPISVRCE